MQHNDKVTFLCLVCPILSCWGQGLFDAMLQKKKLNCEIPLLKFLCWCRKFAASRRVGTEACVMQHNGKVNKDFFHGDSLLDSVV